MKISNPFKHPIGKIEVNLVDIKKYMYNIQELEANKCIVNFQGKKINGETDYRAPLVLECPLQEIIDLINELK